MDPCPNIQDYKVHAKEGHVVTMWDGSCLTFELIKIQMRAHARTKFAPRSNSLDIRARAQVKFVS